FDFLPLRVDVDRTHESFFAHAVANGFLFENFYQTADKLLHDAFMEEQAFHAKTHLAAVEEAPDVVNFHGHVQIGVFHDNHRIAAAEFQGDSFDLATGDFHDVTPDRSRAGEGDAPDAGVA